MTKTNATFSTIATLLAVPLAVVGFFWVTSHGWFWSIVKWAGLSFLGLVALIFAAAGVHRLWEWFRDDEWRKS